MIPILYSLPKKFLFLAIRVPLLIKYGLEKNNCEKNINIGTNRFFNTRFIDKHLNNPPNLSITGYYPDFLGFMGLGVNVCRGCRKCNFNNLIK